MFRVLTPIIRSWYSCNYSFWYWLTGSTAIRFRCWVPTQKWERMVVDLLVLVLADGSRSTSSSRSTTGTSTSNYIFWYWLTGSTTVRFRCWFPAQQRERMVVDLLVLVLSTSRSTTGTNTSNYRFWYWLTGSATIRSRCWVVYKKCCDHQHRQFNLQQVRGDKIFFIV